MTQSLKVSVVAGLLILCPGVVRAESSKFLSAGVMGGGGIGLIPAVVFGLPFAMTSYVIIAGVKPAAHFEVVAAYKSSSLYVPGASSATIFGGLTQIWGEVRYRPAEAFGFYFGPAVGTQTYTPVAGLAAGLTTT